MDDAMKKVLEETWEDGGDGFIQWNQTIAGKPTGHHTTIGEFDSSEHGLVRARLAGCAPEMARLLLMLLDTSKYSGGSGPYPDSEIKSVLRKAGVIE